jgi:hypothetical protein
VCGTQTATDSISFDTFGGGGESRAQALRSTRRRSASKATAGRSANKATAGRRARAGLRERQVVWTSDLQIEGGRGQVVVNGASATQPGVGRAYAVSPAVKGDNRVEATLVTAAGKPGSWRFEFGANSLETGSLRVVAGEVQLVTDNAVVFRLKGTPGERLVFTFRRK